MDERTISVGQLRQNPTAMIRAVRAGEQWILTDRGVPVADIVPHRPPQWVPAEEVAELLRHLGPDPELLRQIEAQRAAEVAKDPWAR